MSQYEQYRFGLRIGKDIVYEEILEFLDELACEHIEQLNAERVEVISALRAKVLALKVKSENKPE